MLISPEELKERLRALATVDTTGWNESDVREDFVAPLLVLLGYRRSTDYDINREESHALSRPFLLVGRQRIAIDYALTVYKRRFWIIEAKGAEDHEIDEAAIHQAYFYAIHPEVAARYFCVTNGWRIQVFDVRAVGADYTPLIDLARGELPERFSELASLLGAGKIRSVLQQRILEDVQEAFASEVDEKRLPAFHSEVGVVLKSLGPVVAANQRRVFDRKLDESHAEFQQIAGDGTPSLIIGVLLAFTDSGREFQIAIETLLSKLRKLPVVECVAVLASIERMLRTCLGTKHRHNLLRLAWRLHSLFDQAMLANGAEALSAVAIRATHDSLSRYECSPTLRAFGQLEASAYRLFYKASFVDKGARQEFERLTQFALQNLSEEDRVFLRPSQAGERLRSVDRIVAQVVEKYTDAGVESLTAVSARFAAVEKTIQDKFDEAYAQRRAGEGDYSFYDVYGVPLDYDVSGLSRILLYEFGAAAEFFDNTTIELLAARLRARSQTYAVNHVDSVLAKYLAAIGRFSIGIALLQERPNFSRDDFAHFASSMTIQKQGRNDDASANRVTLSSRANPDEFLQIEAELDLRPTLVGLTLSSLRR